MDSFIVEKYLEKTEITADANIVILNSNFFKNKKLLATRNMNPALI